MKNTHTIDWSAVKANMEAKKKARITEVYGPVIKAAAVRSVFTAQEVIDAAQKVLNLSDTSTLETEIEQLLTQAGLISELKGAKYWQLKSEVRQKVLTDFSTLDRAAAYLPANAETSQDTMQRMLALYLLRKAPAIQSQSLAELNASVSIAEWLAAYTSDGVPGTTDVRAELKYKELLSPFQNITENFKGRKPELSKLEAFVHQPPEERLSSSDRYNKVALRPFSMMVYGIGGAGKTTLVSKFILNQLERLPHGSFGFVYVDFDRPDARLDPLLLLDEIARQLQLQHPTDFELLQQFRSRWLSARKESAGTSRSFERDYYLDRFVTWWRSKGEKSTLLLILDSFEEVQNWVSASDRENLLRFLVDLSMGIPGLKVVISGRANVDYFDMQSLEIGDFDEESALAYLQSKGIDDEKCAQEIWNHVGGNPLDLKLASSEAIKTGFDNIPVLLRSIDKKRVREVLFRRQLEHIHDSRVKKLAVPGLVVRNVSAEIIQEVLAKPCGLGEITLDEARELMDKLRTEAFLIQYEQGNWRFRADLRSLLIDLSALVNPRLTRNIHDNAVDFYAGKNDPASVAEWVYHRLKRGDDPQSIENIDFNSVLPFLRQAMDELPPRAFVFLASVFGVDLSDNDLKNIVDLPQWERSIGITITNSFITAEVEYLQRLAQDLMARPERSINSPLQLPEALLYERLDLLDKAEAVAHLVIHDAKIGMDIAKQLDAERILISINNRKSDFKTCVELAKSSMKAAIEANETLRACRTGVLLLRSLVRLNKLTDRAQQEIWDQLDELDYSNTTNAAAFQCLNDLLPENFFSRDVQKGAFSKQRSSSKPEIDNAPFTYSRFHAAVSVRLVNIWKDAKTFGQVEKSLQKQAPDLEMLETLSLARFSRPLRDVCVPGIWEISSSDFALFLEKEGLADGLLDDREEAIMVEGAEPQSNAPQFQSNTGNISLPTFPNNINLPVNPSPDEIPKPELPVTVNSKTLETKSLATLQKETTEVDLVQTIEDLIKKDDHKSALEVLITFSASLPGGNGINEDVTVLQARLNAATRNKNAKLLEESEFRQIQVQISYSIQELTKHLLDLTHRNSHITGSEIHWVGANLESFLNEWTPKEKRDWINQAINAGQAVGLSLLQENQSAVVFFMQNDVLTRDPKIMTTNRLFCSAGSKPIRLAFDYREFKGDYIADKVFSPVPPSVFDEKLEFHITGFDATDKPVHLLSLETEKQLEKGSQIAIISYLNKRQVLTLAEVVSSSDETFEIKPSDNIHFQPGSPVFDDAWRVIGMIQQGYKAVYMSAVAASLNRSRQEAEQMESSGAEPPEEVVVQTSLNAVKFVVLYEVEDEDAAKQLRMHLVPLVRSGKILVHFLHSDTRAGEDPIRRVEDELRTADYALCLITAYFVSGKTLDFALKSGRRVIPVRVGKVSIDDTGLENIQSVPSRGRTVSDFANKDEGWMDVVTELRKLLVKY